MSPADKEPQTWDWSYQFLKLSAAERHERQVVLDRYGLYAQLSALLVIFLFVVLRLAQRVLGKKRHAVYDTESTLLANPKHQRWLSVKLRIYQWWLGGDVEFSGLKLGRRDEVMLGSIWTAWLLFLCIAHTGNDYSHLTRRFGVVGTSQFPIQYLLATKRFNPVAFACHTSHERINRWHRGLGWISYFFVATHGLLYLNYYVQVGGLGAAMCRSVPVLGMLAFSSMTLLSSVSIVFVRRYAYRVFFFMHIVVATAIPIIIWFHVEHGRAFMAESLAIFVAHWVVRRFGIVTTQAVIKEVPGTNIIKVVARVPPQTLRRFSEAPASHAYLSIPRVSKPGAPYMSQFSWAQLRSNFLSNPFTVASVDQEAGELTFVVRQMGGPMTTVLGKLASQQASEVTVSLNVDGPYGVAGVDQLQHFDRVLLVAGGVGATFILPLYRHIRSANPSAAVRLVWAIRSTSELAWGSDDGPDIYEDENIRLFVTRYDQDESDGEEKISCTEPVSSKEFDDLTLDIREKDEAKDIMGSTAMEHHKRPDLRRIVDEVLQETPTDRVAVVVCGPAAMVCDLRDAVEFWIQMGRDVYFKNETFNL